MTTKRQGQQLPLPNETRSPSSSTQQPVQQPGNSCSPTPPTYQNVPSTRLKRLHNTYENVVNNGGKLSPCNLTDHVGVPFDEVEEKRLQEAKDAVSYNYYYFYVPSPPIDPEPRGFFMYH